MPRLTLGGNAAGADVAGGRTRVTAHAAPAGLAPPPGNPRFPLVDGVRAIAALSIVVTHLPLMTGLAQTVKEQFSVGVPVFFVISGFLLYRPFVGGRLSGRARIRSRTFARRRLLRIVPGFWVALTVLAIYPGLDDVFGPRAPFYYGFAQTFRPDTTFNGLLVAWSLSTEMTFYLVLPFYAALLDRLCAGRRAERVLRIELTALLLISLGALVFRELIFGPHWNLAYTLPGTFDWFAIGMALAVVSAVATHRQSTPRLARLVSAHTTLWWAAALATFIGTIVYVRTIGPTGSLFDAAYAPGLLHYLWALFAACLVLPAVFGGAGLPQRVLSTRPVAWLGLVSYGIFLWHVPILNKVSATMNGWHGLRPDKGLGLLLVLVIGGGASIALGAASYYIVERPFLLLKDTKHRSRLARPAVATQRMAPAQDSRPAQ